MSNPGDSDGTKPAAKKNAEFFQDYRDGQGRLKQMAIPFKCMCGQPAVYGSEDGWWFCTTCWQKRISTPSA